MNASLENSSFKGTFSRMIEAAPLKHAQGQSLKASWLETPLGPMLAVADEISLYLLEFDEQRGLKRGIERLQQKTKSAILPGITPPIVSIEKEIGQYFERHLKAFKTPIAYFGSPFQQNVWAELQNIPYGETRSYADVARAISNPTGFRAVANANGANKIAIVIPCHRVINTNGELGGYDGGIARKKWLLQHEGKMSHS